MRPLYERSKWTKYQVMRQSSALRKHLPPTQMMSQGSFNELLRECGDIVVKPTGGSRGAGVVRITSVGKSGEYLVHTENRQRTISGLSQSYDYVSRLIGTKSHVVQKRIPLATVSNRPFDMRLIVQRKRFSTSWKVTGKVAKVAGKGYIVTNISRSRGMVLPVRTAIKRSSLTRNSSVSMGSILSQINRVAIRAAETLTTSKLYSGQRIYGLDMGLDKAGNVWIIEANLRPLLSHFQKLKDKTMYRRILKYKKG